MDIEQRVEHIERQTDAMHHIACELQELVRTAKEEWAELRCNSRLESLDAIDAPARLARIERVLSLLVEKLEDDERPHAALLPINPEDRLYLESVVPF